jgi:hypothetical protein
MCMPYKHISTKEVELHALPSVLDQGKWLVSRPVSFSGGKQPRYASNSFSGGKQPRYPSNSFSGGKQPRYASNSFSGGKQPRYESNSFSGGKQPRYASNRRTCGPKSQSGQRGEKKTLLTILRPTLFFPYVASYIWIRGSSVSIGYGQEN